MSRGVQKVIFVENYDGVLPILKKNLISLKSIKNYEIIEKDTNKYPLEESLYNSISKTNLGAVVDVTDQFVLFELEGSKIYELFSSGSPFNFNDFKEKKGSTTQTLLNNIDVTIHNKGENLVNLFVRRSFSEHLYSWINDSASRL